MKRTIKQIRASIKQYSVTLKSGGCMPVSARDYEGLLSWLRQHKFEWTSIMEVK